MFVIYFPRPLLERWAQRDATVCFRGSTWAAQTYSWWSGRHLFMCGRSWCQTRREHYEKSCPPSSRYCWASWHPPARTRERYNPTTNCSPFLILWPAKDAFVFWKFVSMLFSIIQSVPSFIVSYVYFFFFLMLIYFFFGLDFEE